MLEILRKPFRLAEYDLVLLLMVVALTSFGIVMVYSASSVMAAKNFHDGAYFLKRQLIFALVGCVGALVTMRIDYQLWRRWAVPLLFVSLILLVLVLIPGIGKLHILCGPAQPQLLFHPAAHRLKRVFGQL